MIRSSADTAASHDVPVRVQRKRSKGWTMPANTVYVGRPTRFGNPWTLDDYWDEGYAGSASIARQWAVEQYNLWLASHIDTWRASRPHPDWIAELRGKNLACWCPLDHPCHADVLLALANPIGSATDATQAERAQPTRRSAAQK